MDKKSFKNQIFKIAQVSAEELGYEIVDIEYQKGNKHDLLSIFIFKKEGIDLDDCTKMSHNIEKNLDNLEILTRPYYLEISSPGLDRPIKTKDDYRRNLENEVEVKLYVGILKDYNEHNVIICVENDNIEIPIKNISSMKQVIKF